MFILPAMKRFFSPLAFWCDFGHLTLPVFGHSGRDSFARLFNHSLYPKNLRPGKQIAVFRS